MNDDYTVNKYAIYVIILGILLTIFVLIMLHLALTDKTTPVEGMGYIDTLITKRDSIIIEVNNLDSIKDAEIIKVKSLNNDSTLELFYKLIRE